MTYEEYLSAPDKAQRLLDAVREYRGSARFRRALEAGMYFRGENPEVAKKTVLQARKIETRDAHGRIRVRAGTEDVIGNRIGSSFFFRFVCQLNQYLLQNGTVLEKGVKEKLGPDFDRQMALLGEKALVQGRAWGFWNDGRLEVLEEAHDAFSGFLPVCGEMDGRLRLGIQFWQMSPSARLYLRLFEEDGVSMLVQEGSILREVTAKRPYRLLWHPDSGSITDGEPWKTLPIIPLKANPDGLSELTPAIKAKIDAYDRILSDFADNLDRANDVYWVLNNFGGTTEDIVRMMEEIRRVKAVAGIGDGNGGATAEPHTIEVPYAARQAALGILRKELYEDFMALDTDAIVGGSLTNVAIRAACANLNLKADRYEWQLFRFVQELLRLIGVETESIRFQRQALLNEKETIESIYLMRQDIDRRTALTLNPLMQPEEVERNVH